MAIEYTLSEARRKVGFANIGIYPYFYGQRRQFEIAAEDSAETVKYIEEAMGHYQGSSQTAHYSEWHHLLCEASFGKGLTEGLLEMKDKTYRTRHRSLQELEAVVQELNNAFVDLAGNISSPENHLRVGLGLGRLGLAKEGEKILVNIGYWNNINGYLAKK